jgi:hypothetical protein
VCVCFMLFLEYISLFKMQHKSGYVVDLFQFIICLYYQQFCAKERAAQI